LPWGAKTATVAKLRGRFYSFFLGGQNRKFVKVRRRKRLLSLFQFTDLICISIDVSVSLSDSMIFLHMMEIIID